MISIASVNPATAEGRLEFFRSPSDAMAFETGRAYREFAGRYAGHVPIKTRLTMPGCPDRILFVSRAAAIESVIRAARK